MSTKSLNKTVTMFTGLGRKLTKATVKLVPTATLVANVADIAATSPDLVSGLQEFVKRYTAVDMKNKKIDGGAFLQGGGSLIITGILSKVVGDML